MNVHENNKRLIKNLEKNYEVDFLRLMDEQKSYHTCLDKMFVWPPCQACTSLNIVSNMWIDTPTNLRGAKVKPNMSPTIEDA